MSIPKLLLIDACEDMSDLKRVAEAFAAGADAMGLEVERLNTWAGLMSLVDKHCPQDVMDTLKGTPGEQTVALIREVDRLQAEAPKCPLIHTYCGACGCAIREDGLCGCEDNTLHGIARHYGDLLSEARIEVERLRAALTTPEMYADVISEAMEKLVDEVMIRNRLLQSELELRGDTIAAIHTALDNAKAFRADGSYGQAASRVELLGKKNERLQAEVQELSDSYREANEFITDYIAEIDRLQATGNACHRLVTYLYAREEELHRLASTDTSEFGALQAEHALEEVRRAIKVVMGFTQEELAYLEDRSEEVLKATEAKDRES